MSCARCCVQFLVSPNKGKRAEKEERRRKERRKDIPFNKPLKRKIRKKKSKLTATLQDIHIKTLKIKQEENKHFIGKFKRNKRGKSIMRNNDILEDIEKGKSYFLLRHKESIIHDSYIKAKNIHPLCNIDPNYKYIEIQGS